MVVQPMPRALAANALAVQAAYSEYQQRFLARDALRRMYVGTLTLALILAVFAAVLLAIVLGNQLAKPLLLLADGVRQVAAGDLTAKPVFASGDELGGLTRSFAAMTAQVADARTQVQRGMHAAGRRAHAAADHPGHADRRRHRVRPRRPHRHREPRRHAHPAAAAGSQLARAAPVRAARPGRLRSSVEQRFELLATSPEAGERDQWQESFDLKRGDGATLTLLVRATLPRCRATCATAPARV